MRYEGIVLKLLPEETIGEKQLRKRTLILEENSDSPYKGGLAVDFFNDKIDLISGLKTGQQVTVLLNSKVREYNGKWYNSITGWKVEDAAQNNGQSSASQGTQQSDEELFPF